MTKKGRGVIAKKGSITPTDVITALDVCKKLEGKSYDGLYLGTDISRKGKISTGSIALDHELGGGFVRGKIIELYGPESSGKTALAFSMLAQATGINGFIDAESSYERETAEMYGVNTKNLVVQRPAYAEQGMDVLLDMLDFNPEVVVFDSIAGVATKSELEGNMEDHNIGKKAYRMGQLMRKLHLRADELGCTIVFVNQIRDSMEMFGIPVTTPGGHALKFHSTYRLWIKSTTKIEASGNLLGHYMKVNVKKNKIGKPGNNVMVPLIYGYGISSEWELIDVTVEEGVIQKSGSWYSFDGTKLGQGQFNTFKLLMDNPELFDAIKTKLEENG